MYTDKWDNWLVCNSCDAEFRVVGSVVSGEIEYCPYCGELLDLGHEENDDEEEDEELE